MAKKKRKFTLEFSIKSSPKILYNFISTPSGLSEWFSNNVNIHDDVYTFIWDGEGSQDARLLQRKDNKLIRFHWLDDEDEDTYFQLEIRQDDLTGDVAIEVTDFAEEGEIDEEQLVWENQLGDLSRVLGGA